MQTQNEKLKTVFEKLLIYLSPKEISKKTIRYYKSYFDNKQSTYTVIFAECSFLNTHIPIPYNDILVEITPDNICILSDNSEYNFKPDQILTIWSRIKKTLN